MALAAELFPICRSITGNGVRQTLGILRHHIPLQVNEVPSGTVVLDWTVPPEWNIREAYIASDDGTRVVDFAVNNLHIVQYSPPIDAVMSLAELRPHLHTLPDHPDWIPYRTSYYVENWGFCLTHHRLSSLADGLYRVVIDSDLTLAHLSYGELFDSGSATTPCYSPAIFVTLRSPMTISRGSRWRQHWHAISKHSGCATLIDFCLSPARSARLPGSRATKIRSETLSMASSSPASAIQAV